MVKTRDVHDINNENLINIDKWVVETGKKLHLGEGQLDELRSALHLSFELEKKVRDSKSNIASHRPSAFLTGVEMADILADLGLDDEGLIAAILYRHVREKNLSLDKVKRDFGGTVATLIDNVLEMAIISRMRNDTTTEVFGHQSDDQAAKIRQMLVSIIDDVRVALIKLAERACAIRNVKNFTDAKKVRVAREIVDVYAPLAHRLGIGHLKWELEDLAFRYLQPLEYKRIAKLLSEKRRDRQSYIENVMSTLTAELEDAGIQGDISGRAKHIFSIWKKMQRKGISFSKVYDISAVRVLVPTVADCYMLLGIVHNKWRNISDEFDDYIATPKENGYRSLHTAVIGPRNRILEIQIRTFEMHEEAEFGICAHWQYKGTDASKATTSYESKIAWLRQVLEWHDEIGNEDIKDLFHHEGSSDRIYVFTPEGHVVDLPPVSTPLDFAYRIHTEVGHRCRGCRINGRIAPLNSLLKTADQVEIITGKQESPSRDWLSESTGYLHTPRARAKVQSWFRKEDFEKNVVAGRKMLEREFRQLGIKGVDAGVLAKKVHKRDDAALYAAIGSGDFTLEQITNLVKYEFSDTLEQAVSLRRPVQAAQYKSSSFYIYGVSNLLTHIAQCCSPGPGDEIAGYITSGRGVTIHRKDCGSLLRLRAQEPERIIEVSWGGQPRDVYAVPLNVSAYDRTGLLSDITAVINRQGLSIDSFFSGEQHDGKTNTKVTVEVSDMGALRNLIGKLRQIPNVVDVTRVSE